MIIWRFTDARIHSQAAEDRAPKLVAAQFFLRAPYVGYESIHALLAGERPDASWFGIGLATGSLIAMPILGWPSNASPSNYGQPRPVAQASRTCSAPASPRRSWSAYWATRPATTNAAPIRPDCASARGRHARVAVPVAAMPALRYPLPGVKRMT